jgi:hypothetical protein
MKSSGKYVQGRAGSGDACGTTSIEEIVHTIVELSSLCAESARAGGDAWYELSVYVHPRGLGFQVQRHGSVVGGDAPPPAQDYVRLDDDAFQVKIYKEGLRSALD